MIKDVQGFQEGNQSRKKRNNLSAAELRLRHKFVVRPNKVFRERPLTEANRFRYCELVRKFDGRIQCCLLTAALKLHTIYFPTRAHWPHIFIYSFRHLWSSVLYKLSANSIL
jgi:hypothetical protein